MLDITFIPKIPFEGFKWKWASLQPTESLNDPVILLGVLSRLRKLEKQGKQYSSIEFAREMQDLSNDISDSLAVNLAERTGERNLIRNSGQYWRALGLIPKTSDRGLIQLTEFGRRIADRIISQTEFAAITIESHILPNPSIQSIEECKKWKESGIVLYPLRLILAITHKLGGDEAYITVEELIRIVIPLSGNHARIDDYVNFICWYRAGLTSLIGWPNFCPRSNDIRIAREFLLFLCNYGYLIAGEKTNRKQEKYSFNFLLEEELIEIISSEIEQPEIGQHIIDNRLSEIASEIERKRVQDSRVSRPNQAAFRRLILENCERCIITNVTMPEILEAAHIKPYKYHGSDSVSNGFAMRTDIHTLFDAGHLRIDIDGSIQLSSRARLDYGASIPPRIVVPGYVDIENLRWRWENFNGI